MRVTDISGPDQGRRLRAQGLSAQLREATHQQHIDAELAFSLDARLVDRDTYGQLLRVLQGFHLPVEAAVAAVLRGRELPPTVDVVAHLRGHLLTQDLRRLRPTPHPTSTRRTARATPPWEETPVVASLERALGALYVLAGSAVGGRVIARRARASLGDAVPVAFFTSAHRVDPQRDWRALQAVLDAFGVAAGPAGRDQAVQAAQQTFRALTSRLGAHD